MSNIFKTRYTTFLFSFTISVFSVCLFLIGSTGFFAAVNNLFLDNLQGEVSARNEIIVVGIDDESLSEIGSWPWNREIIAQILQNISNDKPTVVGLDVLFLEPREGDETLNQFLETTETPIVLGSKIVDDKIFTSILKNTDAGFVNFQQDSDGKIRKTIASDTIKDECQISFGLAIVSKYFKIDSKNLCGNELKLRTNTLKLNSNKELQFSYTREDFQTIQIKDVYSGNFEPGFFKDKIVLVGSTALDLRSNLNDNFTGIFGDTMPGIAIHANVVNSYLNDSFYTFPNLYLIAVMVFIANFILSLIYFKLRRITFASFVFIVALAINFAVSVLIINLNILAYFTQITLSLAFAYIVSVLIKYTLQNKESRYVKGVFSRYLNKDLLDILIQDASKLSLGGETKDMTVLFSDIRSFTSISEKMTSHELITMINDYLNFMSDIILKSNGTIDKYIGDAIMAFWNAPIADENHAVNAVTSSLEMAKSLEEFKLKFPDYPEIKIGIGVNSGNMTVGNVGGKDRFDYTVLGDNVNLGSRLEGLTKKYGVTIIVSENTFEAYKLQSNSTDIIFRLLDEVKVKGKEQSIKIYEPRQRRSASGRDDLEIIEIYEKAFKLYQNGNFKKALDILNNKKLQKDGPSEKLIERIKELKSAPKDWDGVWKWEEK